MLNIIRKFVGLPVVLTAVRDSESRVIIDPYVKSRVNVW